MALQNVLNDAFKIFLSSLNMSESDRLFEMIYSIMPLEGVSTGMCLKCIQDPSLSCWRNHRKLHLTSVR